MSLKKNITNLAISQIFSYVIPLLQLPYLSHVVSKSHFGLFVFSLSIINIATMVTDFGFDLSIAKKIAEGENDIKTLGCYVYQTTVIKLLLCFLTCVTVWIIGDLSGYYKENNLFLILLLISVFFNSLSHRWLLQGLEKIYIYSRIIIISRLVSFLLLYFLIKKDTDYIFFSVVNVIQAAMIMVASLAYIYKLGVRINVTDNKSILLQFKESLEYFISRISVSLYSTGCGVFLGLCGGNLHQVAIYGVAEQFYRAGVQVFLPVISAMTPYMIRTKNFKLLFKISIYVAFVSLCGGVFGILFGDKLIFFMFGDGYEESKIILNIFMLVIFASALGMIFGYPALMPLGLARVANKSVYLAGCIQIILFLYLYLGDTNITAKSVVYCYLICDWVMFIYRISYFFKKYKREK